MNEDEQITNEIVQQKLRSLGRAFLTQLSKCKGVEFTLFFRDGTRINYNSRDDDEIGGGKK